MHKSKHFLKVGITGIAEEYVGMRSGGNLAAIWS